MLVQFFKMIVTIVTIGFVSLLLLIHLLRKNARKQRVAYKNTQNGQTIIGLFHPYSNAGGGGERVLWCAVRAILAKYSNSHIVIYTGDQIDPEQMISNASRRFNVSIDPKSVQFIFLNCRGWVEAKRYPYFTLLGQSLGSMILGFEALFKIVPDVFIDTMGYSFTYPIFHYIGSCRIGCYVHYPTISRDMLDRVAKRHPAFNNHSFISRNVFLSKLKIYYYKIFAWIYAITGRCSDVTMVNSSWTEDHINHIWRVPFKTHKVYPPCDVEEFLKIPCGPAADEILRIIAVAQFRPEKDHPLMIRSFYQLMDRLSDDERSRIKLLLVGSCRNSEDYQRVDDYKRLCKHFNLEKYTEFHLNVEFEELKTLMQKSTIGLHAMWNEHFGIGIVECMAAGLVMVANKSGGPLMDIIIHRDNVQNRIGYLASDEEEYSSIMNHIIRMDPERRTCIQEAARNSVARFSDQIFQQEFLRVISPLLDSFH